MKKISSTDNQVDRVIDRQLDSPSLNFTPVTKKSRVFSVPYVGPVAEPIPPINLPNIIVDDTEVIQLSNFPQFDGIYTKGDGTGFGIGWYFIRDDGEYYLWQNIDNGFRWQIESLLTFEILAVSPPAQPNILPAEGWDKTGFISEPIPLQIRFLG
jgi:hypothetical protein